jgi:hypothetical protein
MIMGLYGAYGTHTAESCPSNNSQNRKIVIDLSRTIDTKAMNNDVTIVGQYHSALEHTFLWILEAKDGQTIQKFMIESGWAKFNEVKIVPVATFVNVVQECKKIE